MRGGANRRMADPEENPPEEQPPGEHPSGEGSPEEQDELGPPGGADGADPMRDVRLERIVLYDGADRQHIVLRERAGERHFPIVIGSHEAGEIQRVVAGVESERPLTHRLLSETIRALGATVQSVEIVALARGTFYARLSLLGGDGDVVDVDARPSDAIALAMRAACPIRVAESVLRTAAAPSEE